MRRKPTRAQAQVVGIMAAVDGVAYVKSASEKKEKWKSEVLRSGWSSAAGLVIRSRVSALEGDSGSKGRKVPAGEDGHVIIRSQSAGCDVCHVHPGNRVVRCI